MDLATVFGLILAWGAIFVALMLEQGNISDMFNASAAILVVFGTIGATAIGSNVRTLASLPDIVKRALFASKMDMSQIIDLLVGYARIARRNGILALEEISRRNDNKFIRKGVELIVDGTPSMMVREILETEVAALHDRHKSGETIFTTLGGFSPTLGIIGTVMGLISMLAKLNEPSKMGQAIASAFVATLYGVALANLAYLPIAAKLRARTAEEVVAYEMIIEGILSIQAGESPWMVEERMLAFLPPEIRAERKRNRVPHSDGSAIAA